MTYLAEAEGPVEAELDHVVPPDVPLDRVVRVVVPAVLDVPQPRLVPQHRHAEREHAGVVEAAPSVMNDFTQLLNEQYYSSNHPSIMINRMNETILCKSLIIRQNVWQAFPSRV